MGDFNIDILKFNQHNDVQSFVNSLFCNYYLPLINRPSRITASAATLLDNIITNQFDMPTYRGLLYCDISDHLPVFHITSLKSPTNLNKRKPQQNPHRVMNKRNIDNFKRELESINWKNTLSLQGVDTAYNKFEDKF